MSEPLSDAQLAAIRERKAAATGGGRWILLAGRTADDCRVKAIVGEDEVMVGALDFGAGPAARDDKTFVVNAGRDITALLAEVDRLRAELAAARTEPTQPSPEHQAIYLDDYDQVWCDYPTVPSDDQVLPLVWASEKAQSRSDLADGGNRLRVIGWCR